MREDQGTDELDPCDHERSQTQEIYVVVVNTGGGKSLLWTVPPLPGIGGILAMICPSMSLLEEQYHRCVKASIHCHNYSNAKRVPHNVQNLFFQVEHIAMNIPR